MNKLAACGLACLALLLVPGCKISFEQAQFYATIGGAVSAQAWVISAKPKQEQINAISGALDVTATALDNYSGQGNFSDALPQIYQGIEKLKLSPELTELADSLVSVVVLGVDTWFTQNPDWKNKGKKSSQIALAFVNGAKNSLPTALEKTKGYSRSAVKK
jgi:hypothetical protein